MTAILCTVRDGRAYLGADSRVTQGWVYRDTVDKILNRGPWAFALCGSASGLSWLQHAAPEQRDDEANEAYLYRLASALADHGGTPSGKLDDDGKIGLFAICQGEAWQVMSRPVEIEPVRDVIGGGDSTATVAALLVARDHRQEADAIRRALTACAAVGPGIGGPIHVWSSGPEDAEPVREA